MKMFKHILLATSLLAMSCSVDAEVRLESPPVFPTIDKQMVAAESAPVSFHIVCERYLPSEVGLDMVLIKSDDGDGGVTYPVYGLHAFGYVVQLHEQLWPPLRDVPNYVIQTRSRQNFDPGPIRRV